MQYGPSLIGFLWIYLIIGMSFLRSICTFPRAILVPFNRRIQRTSFFTHSALSTTENAATDPVIEKYKDELISLRGEPELIDKLESLVVKHPGIEVNPELYQLFFPFRLDSFQLQGLQSLIEGNNVLVMTPTGSGKTIVGELAIYFSLMMQLRVIYTTPLKALSNQKFQDFRRRFGGDRVGLLTGEVSINKFAPVVIMTTEVLRNMIYDSEINSNSREALSNVFMICFDEFHYMNDPDRGTVWEECIISCPPSIRMLALSATVGNLPEIQDWINSIHGPTEIIQSDYRPVPLRYLYAVRSGLFPLFRDPNAGPGSPHGLVKKAGHLDAGCKLNPSIVKLEREAEKELLKSSYSNSKFTKKQQKTTKRKEEQLLISRRLVPSWNKIIEELFQLKKLPAIFFIFSREGCEEAARNAASLRLSLLNRSERAYIASAIDHFTKLHPLIPISSEAIALLHKGISVHHAGLITVWKNFIEELFIANKIKVLFATETLAAGVNMPARTTVISSVSKKIGPVTSTLKTSQLLQMAGRAGRRGKDNEGTVIFMRNRFDSPVEVHRLLTSPIDGIASQFKASYAFVIKLLSTKTLADCRSLIERGFGTFLAQKKRHPARRRQMELAKEETEGKVGKIASTLQQKQHPILLKYSWEELRSYQKLMARLTKEQKNLDYLIRKHLETDQELVEIFTDYMSIGSMIRLKSGVIGYFLGDMMIAVTSTTSTAATTTSISFYSAEAKRLEEERREIPSQPTASLQRGEEEEEAEVVAGSETKYPGQKIFESWLSFFPSNGKDDDTATAVTTNHREEEKGFNQRLKNQAINKEKKNKKNKTLREQRLPAYGLFTATGDLICFQRRDIQSLVSLDHPLQQERQVFQQLLDLILYVRDWQRVYYDKKKEEEEKDDSFYFLADYDRERVLRQVPALAAAITTLTSASSQSQEMEEVSREQQYQLREIQKQEQLLLQLQQEVQQHIIARNEDTLAAESLWQDLAKMRESTEIREFIERQQKQLLKEQKQRSSDDYNNSIDNDDDAATIMNRNRSRNRDDSELGEQQPMTEVWERFLEMIHLLEAFDAIQSINLTTSTDAIQSNNSNNTIDSADDHNNPSNSTTTSRGKMKRFSYQPTEFGELVGSLSTENDLWVALVLQHPSVQRLTSHEFAGLMAAIMCDSSKTASAFYRYAPSSSVLSVIEDLLPTYQRLFDLQSEKDIDYPILLAADIAGIVEAWSKGLTWLELCQATSLEQGDLYRILKRSLELLRSIPQAYQVSAEIVEKAREAFGNVNRFPLVEAIEEEEEEEISRSEIEEEEKEEEAMIEVLDSENVQNSNESEEIELKEEEEEFPFEEEDFLPDPLSSSSS